MTTVTRPTPQATPQLTDWSPGQRVGFRFVAAFFAIATVYLIPTWYLPGGQAIFGPLSTAIWRQIHVMRNALFPGAASTPWSEYVTFLATEVLAAALVALVWSVVDRRRRHYRRSVTWLRTYLRYYLALVMLGYGMAKVIPVQFPQPPLMALMTPLGEFDRMRLMWLFMGASPPYVVFGGILEVSGALLLLFQRTALAGAALLAAVLSNVLALNLFYAVGVAVPTTVYLLAALALLAPAARRLVRAFLEEAHSAVAVRAAPAGHGMAWRPSALVKLAVLAWAVGVASVRAWRNYHTDSDGAPLPPLYGLYTVATEGPSRSPEGVGTPAWRRLAISERGAAAVLDDLDQIRRFNAEVDTVGRSLLLRPWDEGSPSLRFAYDASQGGVLLLTAQFGPRADPLVLRREDLAGFRLREPLWRSSTPSQ